MINYDYTIDISWQHEGGSCQVYPITNNYNLAFKEFYSKQSASRAISIQAQLAQFDLAPQVVTRLCKLYFDSDLINESSGWGYITELADKYEDNTIKGLSRLQQLVENIRDYTGLKFWDCHWGNVGLIKRGRSKRLVCIDTGKESFEANTNAWGNVDPGPKCCYCLKYNCKCEE